MGQSDDSNGKNKDPWIFSVQTRDMEQSSSGTGAKLQDSVDAKLYVNRTAPSETFQCGIVTPAVTIKLHIQSDCVKM